MNDTSALEPDLFRRFLFLCYQEHQKQLFPLPLLKYFQPWQAILQKDSFAIAYKLPYRLLW